MRAQGCTQGQHTDEAPPVAPKAQPAPQVELKMTSSQGGAETYSSAPVSLPSATASREATPAPKFEEEEDDLSAPVVVGTTCRHTGCSVEYESDELHRTEGGAAAECTYHPKPVSRASLVIWSSGILTTAYSQSSMKAARCDRSLYYRQGHW